MAIKKRTPVEQRALEDAFASGADDESTPVPAAPPPVSPVEAQHKPIARKLLLRFPDDQLPLLIERLAAEDGRSKHSLTLRALARGLKILEDEQQAS